MTQPLFLIGPRGCGKTTVGMALADSLNRRFVDTDQWLQSQLNMTVAEIDRFSFYTASLTPFTKLNIKCGQQYPLLPKHKNFHVRLFLRNAKTNIV